MIRVKDQQDFPSIKENEKFSKSLRLGKSILENLENKIVSEQCRKFFWRIQKPSINKKHAPVVCFKNIFGEKKLRATNILHL